MKLFNSAMEYHERTKYKYDDIKFVYREFAKKPFPNLSKEYPNKPVVELVRDFSEPLKSFSEATARIRQSASFRQFSDAPISKEQLSHLLYLLYGVTSTREFPNRKATFRAAPSASGLYPTNVYVLVSRVTDVPPGIYYFHPETHRLIEVEAVEPGQQAAHLGFDLKILSNAPVHFVFTSTFSRNSWKFKDRAYRYCLMDAGHVGLNLVLGADALGMSADLIGDFVDEEMNRFLQIDGFNEAAVMMGAAGLDDGPLDQDAYTFGMIKPEEDIINDRFTSLIRGIHQNSSHYFPGDQWLNVDVRLPFNKAPRPKEITGDLIQLPKPITAISTSVHEVIEKRRSTHNFLRIPLTREELSTLLDSLRKVPALYNFPAFHTYVVINDVDEIENGVYLYRPQSHELELIKTGTFRGDISYLTLAQDAVFNCSVAFFFAVDFEDINIFANRGYRYAHFNVGMLSETIYLTGTALGIGVRGIGNFFDDSLNTFFKTREPHENVLGGAIVGRA